MIHFDDGATHHYIHPRVVKELNLPATRFGAPITADVAFEGLSAEVTPIIGKLRLEIGDYVDHENFVVGEMAHCDVILGMPWQSYHRLE